MKKLLIGSLTANVVLLGALACIQWLMPALPPSTAPIAIYVFTNSPDTGAGSDLETIRKKESDALKSQLESLTHR